MRTTMLLLAAGLAGSCGRGAPGPTLPAPEPEPIRAVAPPTVDQEEDPAEAARAAARERDRAEMERAALDIVRRVADARKLPVTAPFTVQLIDKPGIRAFVTDALHQDMTPERIAMLGRVEASLGVIPVGSDGEQILLDLYEQGVLGIYDDKKDTLLIGEFLGKELLPRVVGHESAHGLQDMNFDLDALQKPLEGRSDAESARSFLLEGDAEASFLTWMASLEGREVSARMLRSMSDSGLELIDDSGGPPVLLRMLQMPYTDGTATVVELARRRGWSAVDALYTDVPASTEQMLHVDKLLDNEQPLPVQIDIDRILAEMPGHELLWEDEIGEAGLLAMLAEVLSPREARGAADGWGGDRFVALERTGQTSPAPPIVGIIAMDTESDAKDLESGLRAYFEHTKPDTHALKRRGSRIVYITHATEHTQAVSRAAWKAFKVGKPAKGARR